MHLWCSYIWCPLLLCLLYIWPCCPLNLQVMKTEILPGKYAVLFFFGSGAINFKLSTILLEH